MNISFGDFLKIEADIFVIPHSTEGLMDELSRAWLSERDLEGSIPVNVALGHVQYLQLSDKSKPKFIAFACTIQNQKSSYSALRQIARDLIRLWPDALCKTIVLPVLGASGKNVKEVQCFQILKAAFEESQVPGYNVEMYCLSRESYESLSSLPNKSRGPSALIVLELLAKEVMAAKWVTELTHPNTYYFEHALRKFNDYLNFDAPPDFFYSLLNKFQTAKTTFSKFIQFLPANEKNTQFLVICGQLIAYIDKHAYLKKEWNEYEDKRTMAASSVNQTRWIEGLIRYRMNGNTFENISPSIVHALSYLQVPESNLTMLSLTHRTLCFRALLNIRYTTEELPTLFEMFDKLGFVCENPLNKGYLISRILYSPEIKALWLEKSEDISETITITETTTTTMLPPNDPPAEKLRLMALSMHPDVYSKIDLLNYESYATVIARMITSGLSKPPLNISIMAPWGKGKTTLMRFIAQKISQTQAEKKRFAGENTGGPVIKEWPKVSVWNLFQWLGKKGENLFTPNKLSYPVIWFNAWKFQKNEQIWAGLAHEIITQMADQLPDLEREKFWLRLNIKRLDREKIKREIIFQAIQKSWFPLVVTLLCAALGVVGELKNWLQSLPQVANWLPLVGSAIWLTTTQVKKWKAPPEIEIGKYVLQPEYKSKMGYYSEVEEDLRHAFELLANPKEPPVIFIDDLDRCSPPTVAEVVEAINLFISGDMSDCYFILGQDAQIVAAALDVAYENVAKKTVNIEKHHGSMGWYFMEKFIQLQLNIPTMTSQQSSQVLQNLFAIRDEEALLDEATKYKYYKTYEALEERIAKDPDLDELLDEAERENIYANILLIDAKKVQGFQEKIIDRVIANCEVDDNELKDIITWAAPFLSNSLREIKRFANLFTFYSILKYTASGKSLREFEPEVLSKWILIMIRWPQLVRAIQWDTEKTMLSGETPLERAKDFETLIIDCVNLDLWKAKLKTRIMDEKDITWQHDVQLVEFFNENIDKNCNTVKAVEVGLW
ncbi:KAP family P-loop NTPase fold protein [Pedobacter suwonensis]|uniref:KAP family P-loop NTPase fold protein n=1 Tax=Pedobacter suwonensis TaxID=332999 RepID=UPI003682F494